MEASPYLHHPVTRARATQDCASSTCQSPACTSPAPGFLCLCSSSVLIVFDCNWIQIRKLGPALLFQATTEERCWSQDPQSWSLPKLCLGCGHTWSVPPCPAALLAWPRPCHYMLSWQLCSAGAGSQHRACPARWLHSSWCGHRSPSPASTRPCCSLAPLFPSHKGIKGARKCFLIIFLYAGQKVIIYLIALGKQKPLHTSVPMVT